MALLHQVKSYVNYWLLQVDEHSLHSPFFYDFFTNVVHAKNQAYPIAEKLRTHLLSTQNSIDILDLGAGSVLSSTNRKVRDIAKVSLSSSKFSSLYARAIHYFSSKEIIELGTCFGINTLYLAKNPSTHVTTFEGVPAIAEIAKDTFSFAGCENIELVEGNIDDTLAHFLQGSKKVDFAFIDANHRYAPAIQYFEILLQHTHPKTILVLDDIHLNIEMEKAWEEIKNHPLVYASADLFRCGFIFQIGRAHV